MKGSIIMNDKKEIKRGEIYYADLSPVVGSEQGGVRPVIIIQNDKGNMFSPTTIVVTMSTKTKKKANLPTHALVYSVNQTGLKADSVALCEQIHTIDKSRLREKIGSLNEIALNKVMKAVSVSLSM
jgi:mRNA interferase MazF